MTTGHRIRIRGRVQGVGFRPHVWRLARRLELRGDVRNDAEGVLIRVVGADVNAFLSALALDPPPLARVDDIEVGTLEADWPDDFTIAESGVPGADTGVPPDAATCSDCLTDIRGHGRRAAHAFANCTACGPRFSILESLPYDRARTSMASFRMCAACRAEYENPADRRFHAQPVACPDCGPTLALEPSAPDPLAAAAHRLTTGGVVAIKGLGGFHLACDATDPAAVARLRTRKRRPTKPFALMGTMAMVHVHARVSAAEEARLTDPVAPIVLLERRAASLPDAIAPGLNRLGWMLPATPLHHLLLDAVARPLVMTSGNRAGAPPIVDDAEARTDLSGIADALLLHDRRIVRRLDDSVEQVACRGPVVLRHARGHAPGTLTLPPGFEDGPEVIAYGGHLKSAICLTGRARAVLSQHLGDLDDVRSWAAFLDVERDYAALFEHVPHRVACDRHPDYRSSAHARARGLPLVEVQHHHAHLAACLAENGWPRDGGAVAGIVLDGSGLGLDGTVWGGELLLGDYRAFTREAWLEPALLLGGDAAAREPWRNTLARLDQAGLPDHADRLLSGRPRAPLRQAAAQDLNAPLSSSAGRLFDAVSGLVDSALDRQGHEGEAAMRLEALARERRAGAEGVVNGYDFGTGVHIGVSPAIRAIVADLDAGTPTDLVAMRFHTGLARAFAERALALVEGGRAKAVALSGGCFQNTLLLDLTIEALGDVPVLVHRWVPPNDGGLALGQALVAMTAALPPEAVRTRAPGIGATAASASRPADRARHAHGEP